AGVAGTTGCSQDSDCDTSVGAADGVCGNFDPTPNDGNRGGRCYLGANDGLTCDGNAPNTTFNAPQGSYHSLDCFPTPGKNVSGSGLAINLTQTTGSVSLSSALPCGTGGLLSCPCGMCSGA